jgi:hypothetical protein
MAPPAPLEMTLLPGARALLAAHARELPQRDDLCGAFCGALALGAAGLGERGGEPNDQDAVAQAAGSTVSAVADIGHLPHGEQGRRDYRLALPRVEDAAVSGTTAAGVVRAVQALSGGALAAVPYAGLWTAETLGGLFDAAAASERPVTLIANIATRHLWGGRPRAGQLLDYMYDGALAGPPPDWDVGHFVCVFGRMRGPGGSLYGVADTYPALGNGGVHVQPAERLAAAIERRDRSRETLASSEHPRFGQPAGGVVVVVTFEDLFRVRACAREIGLVEEAWDNGSVAADAAVNPTEPGAYDATGAAPPPAGAEAQQ